MKVLIKVICYRRRESFSLLEDGTMLFELFEDDTMKNCVARKHIKDNALTSDKFLTLVKMFINPAAAFASILEKLRTGTQEEKEMIVRATLEALNQDQKTMDDNPIEDDDDDKTPSKVC